MGYWGTPQLSGFGGGGVWLQMMRELLLQPDIQLYFKVYKLPSEAYISEDGATPCGGCCCHCTCCCSCRSCSCSSWWSPCCVLLTLSKLLLWVLCLSVAPLLQLRCAAVHQIPCWCCCCCCRVHSVFEGGARCRYTRSSVGGTRALQKCQRRIQKDKARKFRVIG